ncbi:hypothetical protein D3C80_762350 [compost metagenome]
MVERTHRTYFRIEHGIGERVGIKIVEILKLRTHAVVFDLATQYGVQAVFFAKVLVDIDLLSKIKCIILEIRCFIDIAIGHHQCRFSIRN